MSLAETGWLVERGSRSHRAHVGCPVFTEGCTMEQKVEYVADIFKLYVYNTSTEAIELEASEWSLTCLDDFF